MLSITDVSLESFEVRASLDGSRLVLTLVGTGDMAAVDALRECLVQTRADVERLGLDSVQLDIRSLYLLNSSCIKCLVRFIYLIDHEGPAFPVEFRVDHNLTWQRRALSALERMAPRLIAINER